MQARDRRPSRRAGWQAVGLDVALALMCAYAAGLLATEVTVAATGRIAVATVLIAIAHGASVVLRRRAPLVMVSLLLVTSVGYAALGRPVVFLGPAVLVAMYSVAAWLPRRRALATLAGVEVALAALVQLGPGTLGLDSLALFVGLVAGAWFLGDIARRWRALAEENGRQVEELQRARAELAAQALALERLRIARELHDVVAHSMSMVAMHSGAARLAVGSDPAAELAALDVVERATRDALAEMRRLVAVLREHPDDEADELSPAPGLGDLSGLVAEMADVGLVVDVRTKGDLTTIPAGLSLTAERVLQEALTNVARHVGPTKVRVVVVVADDVLGLLVENQPAPGPAPSPVPSGGHGLKGMRERVQLYGGTLHIGPTPAGGWRVEARLPRERAS